MGKRKAPYDHDFRVRIGRKGGKIGGSKGGKRKLETMTQAARTALAYQAGLASGEARRLAMLERARPVLDLQSAGVSMGEIARRLQMPLSTVYRLARAL